MSVRCTSCGQLNPNGANYCQRCGSLLEGGTEDVTAVYRIDEASGEAVELPLSAVGGPALVIRAGGGREGESFLLEGEEVRIGRRPECQVFLDDITVSREHAVVRREGERWLIEDLGSLNGTYVNRERIERAQLEDTDELQIGKYKLIFRAG